LPERVFDPNSLAADGPADFTPNAPGFISFPLKCDPGGATLPPAPGRATVRRLARMRRTRPARSLLPGAPGPGTNFARQLTFPRVGAHRSRLILSEVLE
jgi:hypothetical protein